MSLKEDLIDRVKGLVNGEGHKILLVKERYLVDQLVRLGRDLMLETQVYILLVKDFDDIKELDEKMMEECGWVRVEKKPKILSLSDV